MSQGVGPTGDDPIRRNERSESLEDVSASSFMRKQFPHPSSFLPVEAYQELSSGDPEKDDALHQRLLAMPSFPLLSRNQSLELASNFEHVVNFTGYSGQGIHAFHQELLPRAFNAIAKEQGWDSDSTLLISGGTDLGIPKAAIDALTQSERYTALGIMALPGVEYPLGDGYYAFCTSFDWKDWGSETSFMNEVATSTLIAGGGTQAFEDALISADQGEKVIVITNVFNALSRIDYELDGKQHSAIISEEDFPSDQHILSLTALREIIQRKSDLDDEQMQKLQLTSLPVSGLVTETRNGERRACAQDLLYFAITGERELLPTSFQQRSPGDVEQLRQSLISNLDLYYLMDDPNEGVSGASTMRLNELIEIGFNPIIERIIQHACEHEVYDSASGCFGPAALGARSERELADKLTKALTERLSSRKRSA